MGTNASQSSPLEPSSSDEPRLALLPATKDVGEQIVDSDEWFSLGVPTVVDGSNVPGIGLLSVRAIESHRSPALVLGPAAPPAWNRSTTDPDREIAETKDDDVAFHGSIKPFAISSAATASPVEVRFSPKRTGEHVATLTFASQWSDGVTTTQDVAVHGRARRQKDVPLVRERELERVARETSATPDSSPEVDATSAMTTREFVNATKAETAASKLADDQLTGLEDDAKAEIERYTRAPPEAPFWVELAELAIGFAITGIAGFAAKGFLPTVTSSLSPFTGLASSARDAIANGATDIIKDGLKTAGKHATSGMLPKSEAKGTKLEQTEDDPSTDSQISFFVEQRLALNRLAVENKTLVASMIALFNPVEAKNPGITDAALKAMQASFNAAALHAEAEQARNTEIQWLAGLSRGALGAHDIGHGIQATDAHTSNWKDDGVIEIDAKSSIPLDNHSDVKKDSVTPYAASVWGVGRNVADRMLKSNLAHEAIPIVVHVHGPRYDADLRRDEGGRVESYAAGDGFLSSTDPLSLRTAAEIVDIVLSKPLSEWGVGKMKTDDAHEKRK